MFAAPEATDPAARPNGIAAFGAAASANARRYIGPERRANPPAARHWLAMLDEIDYGMLLLDADGRTLHVNHAGRAELDAAHPLQLQGRALHARHSKDEQALCDALHSARRGLRKLLLLGEGAARMSVSVVPLHASDVPGEPVTLVMLGKRQVSEELSLQAYARSHGLTPAEGRVLAALCRGTPPNTIAAQLGVAISTVRSQISTVRQKTAAPSIRALVQQVAVLPPLMGVLRGLGGRAGGGPDDGGELAAA